MPESEGLTISRRRVITAGTAAALVGIFAPDVVAAPTRSREPWDHFLATARERARTLLADPSTPIDEYVHLLASLAARIDAVPPTKVQDVPWTKPPVRFGLASPGQPFVVIEWQLAPGATLPPHNHPNASVCTIGLEGEAEIENYEILGTPPAYDATTPFRVRRTHRQLLAPRSMNTLTPTRDNVHMLRGGSTNARGIDVTSLHGPSRPFSYMRIEEAGDTAIARWWNPTK